ncbi:hypothetical protein D8674_033457 [Pyrus ussuriensis x Pyrus communis]|uniref:Uncharacterized protein n=1 Tax=Pyrus ussuriensis x Pyrus communis TaxID=2448454 RepID=A0A5N5HR92_9ROSA|nr:hypothetical protein D8674_033457 [Pyrus ussuriensis x Pyrus communis]
MDKLIIVWHWHAFGGNLYFKLSKFQREGIQKKMLFQAGDQGTRPTFFEMEAAQQLPASLRATLTYSINVLALRRPSSTGFSTTRTSSSPCSCSFSKLIAYELQALFWNSDSSIDQWLFSSVLTLLCSGI